MKRFLTTREIWNIFWLALITALIALPVYYYALHFTYRDYFLKLELVRAALKHGFHVLLSVSNPVYYALVAGIRLICKELDLPTIALWIQIFAQILFVLLVYFWLGRKDEAPNWLRIALSISVSVVAPIMVLEPLDGLYYHGYIGIANYHNPTIHLLKPAAWLAFVYTLPVFDLTQKTRAKHTLTLACLTILSSLVKPSYLLCMLPAAGALAATRLALRQPMRWRLFLYGFLLPAIGVLLCQFILVYLYGKPGEEESAIVFAPFTMMSALSAYLLPKLLLSILFPLLVLIMAFRKAIRDQALILAWAGFAVSLAQTYLLAESGGHLTDGNFGWGSEIMLLILFVVSVAFLWREEWTKEWKPKPSRWIILLAYLAHVAAGVVYWIHAMQSKSVW